MAWTLNATPTAGAGTVSVPANTQFNTAATLTGVGTSFVAGNVGQMIIIGNFAGRINAVASATSITLDRAPQMAISGATYSTVSGTVRVVQTGTDTNTTGISAIAGVQTRTLSEHTEYIIPYLMQIDGTWTQTYREKLSMVRRVNSPDWLPINDSGEIVVNGTWNWGEFVTINGATIARETLPLTFSQQVISAWQNTQRNSVVVNASGRLNWIGARIKASTLFWVNGGYFFGREVIVDRQETDMINDQQFRFLNGATLDIIGIKVYRGCFTVDSRNTSINLVNFKGYEPIHVTKAMTWSGVANSYTITDGTVSTPVGGRLVVEDYNGRGCTLDHGTWVNGLADFVNPVNGTNITSAAHLGGQFASEGHTRVYSSARFNHRLPNGTALQNIITYMADNATGADIPYNLTLKYVLTSNASGNSEGQFLTGYRYVPKNAAQIIRPTIRRSISQADDIYTFYHGGYDIIPFASSNNLIGSGQKQFAYTDALDVNVTLSRTNALALLGTKFTISGTTITVNQNATYDELYDATKAFKFQGTTTAFETPTLDSLIVTPNGTKITAFAGWNLVVNTGVTLSGGVKFGECYFDTITLNGTGKITGVYQDTTGTSTVLTISGFAANSAVYVEDNAEVQKYFNADVTGSVVVYIPPTATGSWYYAVEKFGNQRQSDFFTFSGGQKLIVVKELPDTKILLTEAQITALPSIDNPDEAYDAIALLRTGLPYISFGQIVSKDGAALYGYDYDIVIDAAAAQVCDADFDNKLITFKSSLFEAGPVCNLVKVDVPKTVTANAAEQITVNIEDANGDSNVSIDGVVGSLVDVWKCVNGTVNADFATGTKIATNIGAGKFRFIGQSGFKLIFYDKNFLLARDCSMLKGIYALGWYVFDSPQGGLNQTQAAKFETIYSKVDVIDNNVVDLDAKVDTVEAKVEAIPNEVWENPTRTLTSAGASGVTLAEIEASTILAKEATGQLIKTKVDTLQNADFTTTNTLIIDLGNPLQAENYEAPDNESIGQILSKVELLENTDLTGIATTENVTDSKTEILTAVDLTFKTSEYTAPDNAKIQEIKTKVDTLQNADFTITNSKIDAVKTKVDALENYNDATAQAKLDAIKAKTDVLENTNLEGIATATDVENAKTEILTEVTNIEINNEAIATEVWNQEPERLKQVATVQSTGEQIATFNNI
jgi:polyhydroxyalkanoate synthesis regulator phasin